MLNTRLCMTGMCLNSATCGYPNILYCDEHVPAIEKERQLNTVKVSKVWYVLNSQSFQLATTEAYKYNAEAVEAAAVHATTNPGVKFIVVQLCTAVVAKGLSWEDTD